MWFARLCYSVFFSSEWPECPHACWQQWSYLRGTTASLQWGQGRHAEQGQTHHYLQTISPFTSLTTHFSFYKARIKVHKVV